MELEDIYLSLDNVQQQLTELSNIVKNLKNQVKDHIPAKNKKSAVTKEVCVEEEDGTTPIKRATRQKKELSANEKIKKEKSSQGKPSNKTTPKQVSPSEKKPRRKLSKASPPKGKKEDDSDSQCELIDTTINSDDSPPSSAGQKRKLRERNLKQESESKRPKDDNEVNKITTKAEVHHDLPLTASSEPSSAARRSSRGGKKGGSPNMCTGKTEKTEKTSLTPAAAKKTNGRVQKKKLKGKNVMVVSLPMRRSRSIAAVDDDTITVDSSYGEADASSESSPKSDQGKNTKMGKQTKNSKVKLLKKGRPLEKRGRKPLNKTVVFESKKLSLTKMPETYMPNVKVFNMPNDFIEKARNKLVDDNKAVENKMEQVCSDNQEVEEIVELVYEHKPNDDHKSENGAVEEIVVENSVVNTSSEETVVVRPEVEKPVVSSGGVETVVQNSVVESDAEESVVKEPVVNSGTKDAVVQKPVVNSGTKDAVVQKPVVNGGSETINHGNIFDNLPPPKDDSNSYMSFGQKNVIEAFDQPIKSGCDDQLIDLNTLLQDDSLPPVESSIKTIVTAHVDSSPQSEDVDAL